MTYDIRFDPLWKIPVVRTAGKMNGEDFVALARDLLVFPQRRGCGGVLFDHSALDFGGVPVSDLEMVRAFHREHDEQIGPGRSAMLVSAGMTAQWNALWSQGTPVRTQNQVRVFESYEDAAVWASAR